MKANKRIRDLKRRSDDRLFYIKDGAARGTTTYPFSRAGKDGTQARNSVQLGTRR